MRMKKKLRRAFARSTPDVLGHVLPSLPDQPPVSAATATPTRRRKTAFREFAATAAAFLLLIAVAGGTVWYFRGGSTFLPATTPPDPTGDPNFTHPSCTDPLEPMPEVYVEDLDYFAENILYPWYLRDFDYDKPEGKTLLGTVCNDSVYVLEKTMGSYTYEFHFDAWDGKLLAILITDYADTVPEFIPETVAEAIALLNEDSEKLTAHSQLVKTGSSGYYAVTVIGVAGERPEEVYYIHAQTGALLDLGEEVEPGYTVGPAPTEDTTPPDGLIPEDIAIGLALEYAKVETASNIVCLMLHDAQDTPFYWICFDDGTYFYEISIHAYSGELLAFPTPVRMEEHVEPSPPDGRISEEMALEAALNFLGITKEDVKNCSCTEESTQYRITLDYQDTHFVFTVGAYNPTLITCEKYQVSGATKEMARNYALDYIGVGMDPVSYLKIEQDMGGEHDNPGFLVWVIVEGVEYQIGMNSYGEVVSFDKLDVGKNADENRTDVIGWRVARDIFLDSQNMRLDEVSEFFYEFTTSENAPDCYTLYINGDLEGILVAKSGEFFYEGDGSPVYDTAILTLDEITEILLEDLGQEIKDAYVAGAFDFCEIHHWLYYEGGVRENDIRIHYEWTIIADDLYRTYLVDAFTGEILSRYDLPME